MYIIYIIKYLLQRMKIVVASVLLNYVSSNYILEVVNYRLVNSLVLCPQGHTLPLQLAAVMAVCVNVCLCA